MKNLKFSRLFAAMMFVACLVLVGCKPQTEEVTVEKVIIVRPLEANDSIIRTWADNVETYNAYTGYDCKITADYIETASYGKHNGPIYVAKTSENSGYIYYKFSQNITGYDAANNYAPYTVECTGKWCAVAYKNLTATSVQMCDAYKTYDFADSLSKAVELYTVENGWFAGIETTFSKVN